MPELPEVETVVRGLKHLEGETIIPVPQVTADRYGDFAAVAGRIRRVSRQGKWVLVEVADLAGCSSGVALHLGMSGQLLVSDSQEHSHIRCLWELGDGRWLLLRDPRGFGRAVAGSPFADLVSWVRDRTAPDPFQLSAQEFAARLRMSSQSVKLRLLDQGVVSGVGNIYADESLWAAKVHPFSREITARQCRVLHEHLQVVLTRAIAAGGSTLRDFRSLHGSSGRAQEELKCYGRGGLPCLRCGRTLVRKVLAGRSTVLCTSCQRFRS
jgi:formamidopyrimidine-DNA glycosylase